MRRRPVSRVRRMRAVRVVGRPRSRSSSVGWVGEGRSSAAAPAELISVDPTAARRTALGRLSTPSVSGDGNIVVFSSSDFSDRCTSIGRSCAVRNRVTGTTTHVPQPDLRSGAILARTDRRRRQQGRLPRRVLGPVLLRLPGRRVEHLLVEPLCRPAASRSRSPAASCPASARPRRPWPSPPTGGTSRTSAHRAPRRPPQIARIDTTHRRRERAARSRSSAPTRSTSPTTAVRRHRRPAQHQPEPNINQVLGWTRTVRHVPARPRWSRSTAPVRQRRGSATTRRCRPTAATWRSRRTARARRRCPRGTTRQVYVRDRSPGITRLVTDTPGQPMPAGSVSARPEISPGRLADRAHARRHRGRELPRCGWRVRRRASSTPRHFDLVSFGVIDAARADQRRLRCRRCRRTAGTWRSPRVRTPSCRAAPCPTFTVEVWMRERPIALDITPTLNFGTVDVGTQSAPQNAVVTNTSGVSDQHRRRHVASGAVLDHANGCGGRVGARAIVRRDGRVHARQHRRRASSSITVVGRRAVGVGVARRQRVAIAPTRALDHHAGVRQLRHAPRSARRCPRGTSWSPTPGRPRCTFAGVALSGAGADQFTIGVERLHRLAGRRGASCIDRVSRRR